MQRLCHLCIPVISVFSQAYKLLQRGAILLCSGCVFLVSDRAAILVLIIPVVLDESVSAIFSFFYYHYIL